MKPPDTEPVLITAADDTVIVFRFVTCEYSGDDSIRWAREATDANIQAEITKTLPAFDPEKKPLKGWRRVKESDLPDREYRNAWRDRGGKVEEDLPHARQIHLERLRGERQPILDQLDREWHRATGRGKKSDADAIEVKRQALRDLPDVETINTITELKRVKLNT